jgi:hypothetical protein
MSIVSGYLVQAFGWRWMFVHRRCAGQSLGDRVVAARQDRPTQAAWLTREEAPAVEAEIASAQAGLVAAARLSRRRFRSPVVVRMATAVLSSGA